jgi:hypothetical protein
MLEAKARMCPPPRATRLTTRVSAAGDVWPGPSLAGQQHPGLGRRDALLDPRETATNLRATRYEATEVLAV